MWVVVSYDLSTVTTQVRKSYRLFRPILKELGFERLQLSSYFRFESGSDQARNLIAKVEALFPDSGNLVAMLITNEQMTRVRRVSFGTPLLPIKSPEQLVFW
jgi:CRISPR-associated endonuclease Cas2